MSIRLSGHFARLFGFVFVVGLLGVVGCAEPRLDENSPIPGGAVIIGRVTEGSAMEFTDSEGSEMASPTMITVETELGSVLALFSSYPAPKVGDWVEVSEGANGRWFVTGYADAPLAQQQVGQPAEPEVQNGGAEKAALKALMNRVLKDAAGIHEAWDQALETGRMADYLPTMQTLAADISAARADAKAYEVWDTSLTPEENCMVSIDEKIGHIEEAAHWIVSDPEDDLGYTGAWSLDPITGDRYEALENWLPLIEEDFLRVDKVE